MTLKAIGATMPDLNTSYKTGPLSQKALSRLGLALETPVRGVGRPVQGGLGVDRPVAMRLNDDDS